MKKYSYRKKIISIICAATVAAGTLTLPSAAYAEETELITEDQTEQVTDTASSSGSLSAEAVAALESLTSTELIQALVYLTDSCEVKSAADGNSSSVAALPSGQTVSIQSADVDSDGSLWFKVCFADSDGEKTGFIRDANLAYSNEDLLSWEEEYVPQSVLDQTDELVGGTNSDIKTFPKTYQENLTRLKEAHPNWIFVKFDTGLYWDTVVSNELGQKSLVSSSSDQSWKNGTYSSSWSIASENIVKYYLDPRNFFSESYIFQFEQLTYNSSYHTVDAVQKILNDTFMSGNIPDSDTTYAQAFYDIGSSLQVSPFHLACRVYQEQGKGTSPLISGTYSGYEGLYNYFNIGASGSTNTKVITSGLTYARNQGWTTRYASLQGGADIISKYYIRKGQDTLYLQKFDVDSTYNGLYTHQYMQNVLAAASEGIKVKNAYKNTDSLDNPFVFKIPVYYNMPATACVKPPATNTDSSTDPTTAPGYVPSDEDPDTDDPVDDDSQYYNWIFKDVKAVEGYWVYDSVKYLYEKNIMGGYYGTELFGVNDPLTREMFATIIYRVAGNPDVTYSGRFSDVAEGKYYSKAVEWCADHEIVKGYNDGRFGTGDNITRQDLATMLYRFAAVMGKDVSGRTDLSTFADAAKINSYATATVSWCVNQGIITGKKQGDTYLVDPQGQATRAECAAMVMRYMTK